MSLSNTMKIKEEPEFFAAFKKAIKDCTQVKSDSRSAHLERTFDSLAIYLNSISTSELENELKRFMKVIRKKWNEPSARQRISKMLILKLMDKFIAAPSKNSLQFLEMFFNEFDVANDLASLRDDLQQRLLKSISRVLEATDKFPSCVFPESVIGSENENSIEMSNFEEEQDMQRRESSVVRVKNNIIPKLEIWLASGGSNTYLASRSTRRANATSWSIRQSSDTQAFCRKNVESVGEALGKFALSNDLVWLLRLGRKKDFVNFIQNQSHTSSQELGLNMTEEPSEISIEFNAKPPYYKGKVNSQAEPFFGQWISGDGDSKNSQRSKLLKTAGPGFMHPKSKPSLLKDSRLNFPNTKKSKKKMNLNGSETGQTASAKMISESNFNIKEEKRRVTDEVGIPKVQSSNIKINEIKSNLRKVLPKLQTDISHASLLKAKKRLFNNKQNQGTSKLSIYSESSNSQTIIQKEFEKASKNETLEQNTAKCINKKTEISENRITAHESKINFINCASKKSLGRIQTISEKRDGYIFEKEKLVFKPDSSGSNFLARIGREKNSSSKHILAIDNHVNQKSIKVLQSLSSQTNIQVDPNAPVLLITLIRKFESSFPEILSAFAYALFEKFRVRLIDRAWIDESVGLLSVYDWFLHQLVVMIESSILSPERLGLYLTMLTYSTIKCFTDLQKSRLTVTLLRVRHVLFKIHAKQRLTFLYMKIIRKLIVSFKEHSQYLIKLFILDDSFFVHLEMSLRNSKTADPKTNKDSFNFVIENKLIKFLTAIMPQKLSVTDYLSSKSIEEEFYSRIADFFQIKASKSIVGDEYIFGHFLKSLFAQDLVNNKQIEYLLSALKLFKKSIPFFKDRLAKSFYLRIIYLSFLKIYCVKQSYLREAEVMSQLVRIMSEFAAQKQDEELMAVFKQLRVLQFFGKEIDLEYELSFFVAHANKSVKLPFAMGKQASVSKNSPATIPQFRLNESDDYNSSSSQSEFEILDFGLADSRASPIEIPKLENISRQDSNLIVKNCLTEENKEPLRLQMHRKTEPTVFDTNGTYHPKSEYFGLATQSQKEKSQKLSLALKLDLVNSPSIQKQSHSFVPSKNHNEVKAYSKHRSYRKIYDDLKFHERFVELILVLLLNRSLTSLNEEFTGQYPIQSGKQNYLFLLVQHLSHDENDNLFKRLFFSLQRRIAKLEFGLMGEKNDGAPTHLGFQKRMAKYFPFLNQPSTQSSNREAREESSFSMKDNCEEREKIYEQNSDACLASSKLQLLRSVQILLKCLKTTTGAGLKIGHKINTGAFSVVNEAQLFSLPLFAVKNVQAESNIFDRNALFYLFNEIAILSNMKLCSIKSGKFYEKHRSLELIDFHLSSTGQYMLLFPKLMTRDKSKSDVLTALRIFNDVVDQVHFLHEQGITHYDIKGDNIMKEEKRHIIVDFGESLQGEQSFRLRGTEYVRSPEMLNSKLETFEMEQANSGRNYKEMVGLYNRQSRFLSGPASDIWALGCLLYELVTDEMLFYEKDWTVFFDRVTRENNPILTSNSISKIADNYFIKLLLEFMLSRNPQQRPNIVTLKKKLKAVCKVLAIDVEASGGQKFELNMDLTEIIHTHQSNDSYKLSSMSDIGMSDFLDENQRFISGFWINEAVYFQCVGQPAGSSNQIDIDLSTNKFYLLDLESDEADLLEYLSSSDNSAHYEFEVRLEKWIDKALKTFWKLVRHIRIARRRQQQLQCKAPLGFLAALFSPILISIKQGKMRLSQIIQVYVRSFYKIKYSIKFLLILGRLWSRVIRNCKRADNYRLIECMCATNCMLVSKDVKYESHVCNCNSTQNSYDIWDCSFQKCFEYKDFMEKRFGVTVNDMTWSTNLSSNIIGVPSQETQVKTYGGLEDMRTFVGIVSDIVGIPSAADLTEICMCKNCGCAILVHNLATKEVWIPQVHLKDHAFAALFEDL